MLRFGFRPGEGTMETKLFATSAEDAAFFAQNILFPLDRKPLTIVEVDIPDSLASRLFRFTTDGTSPFAVQKVQKLNFQGRLSFGSTVL